MTSPIYTPIQFTSIVHPGNPMNYWTLGMGLVSGGLVQIVAHNGIGLVTRGLVWQGPSQWFDPQAADPITTAWTPNYGYPGSSFTISTAWSPAYGYPGSSAAITTVWSESQSFGNEFPQ